jgi:hypothetical protein
LLGYFDGFENAASEMAENVLNIARQSWKCSYMTAEVMVFHSQSLSNEDLLALEEQRQGNTPQMESIFEPKGCNFIEERP